MINQLFLNSKNPLILYNMKPEKERILTEAFISSFRLYWALAVALRLFSGCGQWGLLFVLVHMRLVAAASLVAEHGP